MTPQSHHDSSRMWALTLGALGVVFGDIGTSPLYSLRECFSEHYAIPATPESVLGILSLIIWSLIVVVFFKYILFILQADNKGEGGILSLLALAVPRSKTSGGPKRWMVFLGLFGAALLYGDGMLTPAVTVLSAIEGLKIATPAFEHYIVPATVAILAVIFYFQSLGTNRIGFVFGPIILIYFATLTALGLPQIFNNPYILNAFNPIHAYDLYEAHGLKVLWAMGSVFLAVTGCEALYADMGHFGRKPIQAGWTYIVFPALVINYLGQGALLISDAGAIEHPFFRLAPSWALVPTIVIATLASIVASQALISGVFSLTRQAVLMGFCPRLRIVHTSSTEMGQIYIPTMNWALMISTIWLVVEFKSSANLAGAYGIAVALTMVITTLLAVFVAWRQWRWSLIRVIVVALLLIVIDGVFLIANTVKIPDGGWFPLLIAGLVFTLMTTWKRGRRILAIRLRAQCERFTDYVANESMEGVFKIPGTALFMSSDPDLIPPALARNRKHNKVVHERVVVLSLVTKDVPRIARQDRAKVEEYPHHLYRVTVNFGFMEDLNINEVLEAMKVKGLNIPLSEITFFLGRETLIASQKRGGMALWREHLFSFMSRNSYRATQFFQIPPDQVIEIGSQIEL